MIEQIILGIVQGIAEWLPVSSEGMIVLVETLVFGKSDLQGMIESALFLHLGSALAAIAYFRKDIVRLFKSLSPRAGSPSEELPLFKFLIGTTLISGSLGFILLKYVTQTVAEHPSNVRLILLALAFCLIITAILQLKVKHSGHRASPQITMRDTLILGLVQAFATLPGLSRSGLTVSFLLFQNFKTEEAVRISFLMSIPIVLAGNLVLGISNYVFHWESLLGLLFSFLTSLVMIDILIKLAKRLNFAKFIFIMALLVGLSAFLPL
ncbi:MAG TPA: undecaprenyl-diphosphate phosphatase [Candidatus Omnitrophota bacterium]|nr:undecaprenyl-diphosphate phosphatase [Candidatus Omnitrophota bacterium]HSA30886.1 undecaprenyl-diphosphate phosphatase [Candidatus Omnitrophota bacterium]